MQFVVDKLPTQKEFLMNKEENDKEFKNDIHVNLRLWIEYENEIAYEFIKTDFCAFCPNK